MGSFLHGINKLPPIAVCFVQNSLRTLRKCIQCLQVQNKHSATVRIVGPGKQQCQQALGKVNLPVNYVWCSGQKRHVMNFCVLPCWILWRTRFSSFQSSLGHCRYAVVVAILPERVNETAAPGDVSHFLEKLTTENLMCLQDKRLPGYTRDVQSDHCLDNSCWLDAGPFNGVNGKMDRAAWQDCQ